MKARDAASLPTLLGRDGRLARLTERVAALRALEPAVSAVLPAALHPHCRLANVRGGVVVLSVDGPVWAARAKYLGPALLERLRSDHGLHARELRVRIDPPAAPAPTPLRKPEMPPEAGQALRSLAEHEPDPDLAAALRRLGSRGRR
ncbi:MAG TPA: DUF721 domain-containing protein [Gammaproteobacteria bacterium]|nr:DUF721 domain-containing protein [Gammaproteobacteria bacterium]